MPIYYEARMLIAQSQMEDIAILSDDEAFDHFDVRRFW
jgi:PIN domain nuclease of toxin-antitoxin system